MARQPDSLRRFKRLAAWFVLGLIALSVVAVVAGLLVGSGDGVSTPPVGRLSEPVGELPAFVEAPVLVVGTTDWGLDPVAGSGFDDPMAGGGAIGDLDSDGRADIVVAHGEVLVFRGTESRFEPPRSLSVDDAVAASLTDVDLDGHLDILIARTGSHDRVVWGGSWITDGSEPAFTDLPGAKPSNQLMAGELSGDERLDIVRIGRSRGSTDAVLVADSDDPRRFVVATLPSGDRISLAGELADVDADGLLDIWITRDVGWDIGPDAVFSRRGDPGGPWFDIAPELGVALELDGMGLTIADLDGNGSLDAYVSDLGDNEVLFGDDGGFEQSTGTGAARIRPLGAAPSIISSSWASGAADFNLDGILDLAVVNGGFPDGGVRNKIPGTTVAVADTPSVLVGVGGGSFVDVWARLSPFRATASRSPR